MRAQCFLFSPWTWSIISLSFYQHSAFTTKTLERIVYSLTTSFSSSQLTIKLTKISTVFLVFILLNLSALQLITSLQPFALSVPDFMFLFYHTSLTILPPSPLVLSPLASLKWKHSPHFCPQVPSLFPWQFHPLLWILLLIHPNWFILSTNRHCSGHRAV